MGTGDKCSKMPDDYELLDLENLRLAFEELARADCIPGSTKKSFYVEVVQGSEAAKAIIAGFRKVQTEDDQRHPLEGP